MVGGTVLAWFTTILIGVVIVLVPVIAMVLMPRVARLMHVKFLCRWVHRDVVVHYLTCDAQHPVSVVSCTAFTDPCAITCGKWCVSADAEPSRRSDEASPGDLLKSSSGRPG